MLTSVAAPPRAALRGGAILAVIAVAQLMTALDATVVNIALPTAQRALGFGDAARQWVVTAYTLCFAGLLLLGGRLADVLGRRRSFQLGLAGFAAASLLAGLAPALPVLVAGRALQGAFAAVISPTALSLLAMTFTEARARGRAFAVYGAVASSGAAVGLVLGGVLTEYLEWRWCLFVNVGIAAVLLAAGRRVLPDPPRSDPRPSGPARLDVLSAASVTAGLAAIVFGCSRAAVDGWSAPVVWLPVAGGVLALLGFGLRQRGRANALLPLPILADRGRAGAYLAAAVAVIGAFGSFLMLTYYLQVVLHYGPLRAGVAVLPLALANSVSGYQLGHRLAPRVPPRLLIAAGLVLAAAGLALLARLQPGSGYPTVVLPAEVLVGAGMGALFPPVFAVAVRGVTERDAGVASAVVTTATQVGSSVGTAVLNTLAVSATAGYLAAHPGLRVPALVHGYATASGWASAVLVAAALAVVALVR